MGWLFMRDMQTKEDLVARFRAPGYWAEGTKILKDAVVGNHYWAAIQQEDGRTFVFLALMEGRGHESWGYKDLCCSMHPYYYDCPLSVLAATAEPEEGSGSADWRERVRAHHAVKKERKAFLQVGQVVSYLGITYRLDESLGRRGWNVTRMTDGTPMRMQSRQANAAAGGLAIRRRKQEEGEAQTADAA